MIDDWAHLLTPSHYYNVESFQFLITVTVMFAILLQYNYLLI